MRVATIVLSLALSLLPIGAAWSQDQAAVAAPQQQLLDQAQLDQLVAPIALYSDPLLAQVLMASTYPLEVVQADRWAKANKSLKGDALKAALDKQDWDASVKELVVDADRAVDDERPARLDADSSATRCWRSRPM